MISARFCRFWGSRTHTGAQSRVCFLHQNVGRSAGPIRQVRQELTFGNLNYTALDPPAFASCLRRQYATTHQHSLHKPHCCFPHQHGTRRLAISQATVEHCAQSGPPSCAAAWALRSAIRCAWLHRYLRPSSFSSKPRDGRPTTRGGDDCVMLSVAGVGPEPRLHSGQHSGQHGTAHVVTTRCHRGEIHARPESCRILLELGIFVQRVRMKTGWQRYRRQTRAILPTLHLVVGGPGGLRFGLNGVSESGRGSRL
jgi:hypothetical protein